MLDFGCGWGRYARMFLRDVPADNIWCVDSWDLALQTCEETGVPGRRVKIEQMPPSPLPAATFDTAFAYSVFSHLSPKAHLAWQEEFARVVKPGAPGVHHDPGPLVPRQLPGLPRAPGEAGRAVGTRAWPARSSTTTPRPRPTTAARCSTPPNGGGPELLPEYYGEAVVPRAYFEEHWGQTFEVLEFIADRSRFEQAICIMRRR